MFPRSDRGVTVEQSLNEIRNESMLTIERGTTDARLEAAAGDLDRLNDILTDMLHAARKMAQADRAAINYLDAVVCAQNKRLTEAEGRLRSALLHPSNYGQVR